jgi:hypothetical protein
MEPRRIPEHLVKELVWGFVEENEPEKVPTELTTPTATSISPTTDWVSEYSGGASGRIWGRVVDATVTPTVKDLVTEHIEKVKVTLWQTTNLVIEESGSTVSKGHIVGSTAGVNQTSFSTTTTTIPTTTATTRVAEVPKDYRVFGRLDVDISFEDLHWSYYLLIGFACLAFLVCLAQGLTCLYISLARQKSSSGLKEVKVVCGKKSSKGSLNS